MELRGTKALENWVMNHALAGKKKLYFTINGDVPLTSSEGTPIYFEIPKQGKRICVLHPDHLTQVAQICYQSGIEMIQIQV